MDIEEKIREVLKKSNMDDFNKKTAEELIFDLSSYKEELIFQNEELKRQNRVIEEKNYRLKKLNQRIKEERKNYEDCFYNAPIPYVVIDFSSNILIENKMFKKLVNNNNFKKLTKYINEKHQDSYHLYKNRLRESDSVIELELELFVEDKTLICKFYGTKLAYDKFRILIVNETENIRKQKKIEYLSYYDELTGIHNRRYFREQLDLLDEKKRYPLGVILLDLNGMKMVNDIFGHQEGDYYLKETAKLLKKTFKESSVIARLGGDEFGIILPKTTEKQLKEFVKSLEKNSKEIRAKGINYSYGLGYGIKKYDYEDVVKVLKEADDNLYKNKMLVEASRDMAYEILSVFRKKYPEEMEHAKEVSRLLVKFAKELNFTEEKIEELEMSGLFHDVGKVAIPVEVLNKIEELTEQELKEIRRHTEIGFRILSKSIEYSRVATYVLYHHERIDGLGYPFGIKGEKIPIESKMISIANKYVALMTDKSYRKGNSKEKTIKILKGMAGTHIDSGLLEVFINKII